jgi:transposase
VEISVRAIFAFASTTSRQAEAMRRIDAIFDVEREINGLSTEQRFAIRQVLVAPLIALLEQWMRGERGRLSHHDNVELA